MVRIKKLIAKTAGIKIDLMGRELSLAQILCVCRNHTQDCFALYNNKILLRGQRREKGRRERSPKMI